MMKLKIDEWITENKFSDVVNVLLSDSSLCYKAGAYRASLLFSYLGFLTILKERIIKANKPNIYLQTDWQTLINQLSNEDKWEEAVFTATQQKPKIDQTTKAVTKDAIFAIREELREQIKYWKNRRNDCAHFKDNNIDHYHVESFWAFLESNLPKITIEGGMNTLINRIKDHFNPNLTPPNKDFTYLVKEIEHSVETSRLREFWEVFLAKSPYDIRLSDKKKEFLKSCFSNCTEVIVNSILEVLRLNENRSLRLDFFDAYPEILVRFNFSTKETREFWKTELCDTRNTLSIFVTLLRNGLIPKVEVDEANRLVINLLLEHRYSPSSDDHYLLLGNNFFDAFKKEVLEGHNFIGYGSYPWVNHRADFIFDIMRTYPADKFFIEKLSEHYSQSYYSGWLLERFDRASENGDTFFDGYKSLVQKENIQLPTNLVGYFN